LGKVIWSMISGNPVLQLWYFNRTQFNLEHLFPENNGMEIVNSLLSKCVVEDVETCLPNANELLREIDTAIKKIESSKRSQYLTPSGSL
jgi:hypothetical protein